MFSSSRLLFPLLTKVISLWISSPPSITFRTEDDWDGGMSGSSEPTTYQVCDMQLIYPGIDIFHAVSVEIVGCTIMDYVSWAIKAFNHCYGQVMWMR
jgi:hypothetical protein